MTAVMKAARKRVQGLECRNSFRIPLGNVVAHVNLGDGGDQMLVCVSDLSQSGARLLIPSEVKLPSHIVIGFDQSIAKLAVEARIVWRSRSHVGVHFMKDLSGPG
jgi:hypothetical protein